MMKQAVAERDLDDFKEAVEMYAKACPDVTYVQLEEAFRTVRRHRVPLALRGPVVRMRGAEAAAPAQAGLGVEAAAGTSRCRATSGRSTARSGRRRSRPTACPP